MLLGDNIFSQTWRESQDFYSSAITKKDLGQELVVAKWYEECLVLVSKQALNALLERIVGNNNLVTNPVRGSEHFILLGHMKSNQTIGDEFVIPESLTKYGHLNDDIYFLGVGDRVEIWNKNIWDERLEKIIKDAPSYIDQLINK